MLIINLLSIILLLLYFSLPSVHAFTLPLPLELHTKDPWEQQSEQLPIVHLINKRPIHIGLQVGHWNNHLLPEELTAIRNNEGASSGEIQEWQINYRIAKLTAEMLQIEGIYVEILPATVPPEYKADIFVTVHADQNPNTKLTGFKAAGAWNDLTGKADTLATILEKEYIRTTTMGKDYEVTRGMREYYAFNWQKFEHAIHPETIGVIVETGFLTNPLDQHILLHYPHIPARGLANGIVSFLNTERDI